MPTAAGYCVFLGMLLRVLLRNISYLATLQTDLSHNNQHNTHVEHQRAWSKITLKLTNEAAKTKTI